MKIKKINLSIFLLFIISIFFLVAKAIIYPTITPMVVNENISLFTDWTVIVNANLCSDKGFDVYINNPCDPWGRKHVYGGLLLHLPFVESFKNFYFIYFPIILNLIFGYIVINFFNFKNRLEYLTILPFIFSPSVILAIERANIDIIIFLAVIFASYNRKTIFNFIIITFITVSKFYPISLALIFFYEKKLNKIIINLILFIITVFSLLYFQYDEMVKIFDNSKQFTATGVYNFSFHGLALFFTKMNFILENKNLNWLKYLLIFSCLVIPTFLIIKSKIKFILKDEKINNLFITNIFENRLYILSSIIILSCYFAFSNVIYREIFFLGLVPWIIAEKKIGLNKKFINFYYYLLFTKFMFSGIVVVVIMNEQLLTVQPILIFIQPLLVFIKHCIDLNLILIMTLILFSAFRHLFLKFKSGYVPQKV